MKAIGRILELWRYPISSVTGEGLDEVTTTWAGISGDRTFGLVETATEAPARPERDPRWYSALALGSRISRGDVTEVRLSDGNWMDVLDPDIGPALARHFGFPVSIRPYENRNTVAGYQGPWAVNRYEPNALHLLTTASIARLKALHPAGDPDRRRFRPNILVEMPEEIGAFPETGWVGGMVRVGEVIMRVTRPTRRCCFTIAAQDGLERDPDVLRHIVRSNQRTLGVYCVPVESGRMRVGDDVLLG